MGRDQLRRTDRMINSSVVVSSFFLTSFHFRFHPHSISFHSSHFFSLSSIPSSSQPANQPVNRPRPPPHACVHNLHPSSPQSLFIVAVPLSRCLSSVIIFTRRSPTSCMFFFIMLSTLILSIVCPRPVVRSIHSHLLPFDYHHAMYTHRIQDPRS